MEKNESQKKKCFVITPIGNEIDPIRRHIEGVIDAAIKPALEDEYDIIVAHKITEPGSITKQIIKEIYEAELVIANLTNKNPNVMYELAFRHALGKAVIMIAEKDTSLPSDVIMERTIFYKNDQRGTLELINDLQDAVKAINFDIAQGPIYDILKEIGTAEEVIRKTKETYTGEGSSTKGDIIDLIWEKLNAIEGRLTTQKNILDTKSKKIEKRLYMVFNYQSCPEKIDMKTVHDMLLDVVCKFDPNGYLFTVQHDEKNEEIALNVSVTFVDANEDALANYIIRAIKQLGFEEVKLKQVEMIKNA